MLGRALSLVEQTSEQMHGYYDARSEAWQDSDRGEAFIEMMDSVADAANALREIP
jgi:flagellar biosynthesis/type III secretory pathway ATPase